MNKFKVGDRVVRTGAVSRYHDIAAGCEYTVSKVDYPGLIAVKGYRQWYGVNMFEPAANKSTGAAQVNTKQKQIEELEQQAKDALVKQQELLAKVQELKATPDLPLIDKHGRYLSELEKGVQYFVALTDGYTFETTWAGDEDDKEWLLQGNCFATLEQAETESTRQELIQRARLFMAADRLANDFEPDFAGDNIYPSHYLVLNEGRIYQGSNSLIAYFLTFSSHESRAQFRKEFTDAEIMLILDRG